jgi:hypothetical protein
MDNKYTDEERVTIIKSKIKFLQDWLERIKSELDDNEKILLEILHKTKLKK